MKPGSATVRIETPARLHLGFLDLSAGGQRRFGSLGVAIDRIATQLRAEQAPKFEVRGDHSGRVRPVVEAVGAALGLDPAIGTRIDLIEAIPSHAGLGSGTQLALAVAAVMIALHAPGRSVREVAAALGRGRRSGVGLGTFEAGGFIVDGGRGPGGQPPPVLARIPFPEDWRILLLRDDSARGLHGTAERDAFRTLVPMTSQAAATLCRTTLMGIMPALLEGDFEGFALGIEAVQEANARHFEPLQGGTFTSPAVAAAVALLRDRFGCPGAGQSSWGPTGFVFVADEPRARAMQAAVSGAFSDSRGLRCEIHRGRNDGAALEQIEHTRPMGVVLS